MKFINFFKTTAGIVILVLLIIAIILIWLNWDIIKAWWNDEGTTSTDTSNQQTRPSSQFTNTVMDQRRILINNILNKYGYSQDLESKLNQLGDNDLQIVLNGSENVRCIKPCGGAPPFRGLCLSNCPD